MDNRFLTLTFILLSLELIVALDLYYSLKVFLHIILRKLCISIIRVKLLVSCEAGLYPQPVGYQRVQTAQPIF